VHESWVIKRRERSPSNAIRRYVIIL